VTIKIYFVFISNSLNPIMQFFYTIVRAFICKWVILIKSFFILYINIFKIQVSVLIPVCFYIKGSEFLSQTKIFYPCIFANWWCKPLIHISNIDYQILQSSQFKNSKVLDIVLQKYRDWKNWAFICNWVICFFSFLVLSKR